LRQGERRDDHAQKPNRRHAGERQHDTGERSAEGGGEPHRGLADALDPRPQQRWDRGDEQGAGADDAAVPADAERRQIAVVSGTPAPAASALASAWTLPVAE
jgi:hypothetical protein